MSVPEWRVSRDKPGCYIFLLDHSYSMDDPFAGTQLKKSEVLARAINRYIFELISQCEKDNGPLRNFYDLAVIGYTTDEKETPLVGSALGGALGAGDDLLGLDIVSIVDLYNHPLRIAEQHGVKEPIWCEPVARAGTPMCAGLAYCRQLAASWVAQHPDGVPPILIHISDGESTDGNPVPLLADIDSIRTQVGPTLLFNFHLSSSGAPGIIFPASEQVLPDEHSRMLFRLSSPLPEFFVQMARANYPEVVSGARGMAFNLDATAFSGLLATGTKVAPTQPKGRLR